MAGTRAIDGGAKLAFQTCHPLGGLAPSMLIRISSSPFPAKRSSATGQNLLIGAVLSSDGDGCLCINDDFDESTNVYLHALFIFNSTQHFNSLCLNLNLSIEYVVPFCTHLGSPTGTPSVQLQRLKPAKRIHSGSSS
jgi:hypothetical protein